MKTIDNLSILLIGYNRPDLLEIRLQEIELLPISKLYVSIDAGDYGTHPKILSTLNLFLEKNLNFKTVINLESKNQGLTKHVTKSITRILKEENAVLVLEDDISISHSSYQGFNLGYRMSLDQKHTGVVSGFSPLSQLTWLRKNYWRPTPYFSVWGWIATRDNWQRYRYDLSDINLQVELNNSRSWKRLSSFQQSVWISRFERAKLDPLLTWDTQMQYCSFRYDYSNFVPLFSIVENQGFNDPRAFHTKSRKPRWLKDSKAQFAVAPTRQLNQVISKVANQIDSNTLVGDSKLFHFWAYKIKKN